MNIKSVSFTSYKLMNNSVVRTVVAAAAAFAVSAGYTVGTHSMLNAALAAVFPGSAPVIFASSVVYYLLFCGFSAGAVQICSILTLAVLTAAFFRGSRQDSPAISAALTASVLLVFSLVISAVTDASPDAVIGQAASAVFAGVFVFSFKTLLSEIQDSRTLPLSGFSGFYASVVFVAAVASLSSLGFGVFDPGRAVGCFALLCMAKRFRMTGGAAVGALTSCAVFIGAPTLFGNTLLLATAGLICGAFAELGVLAVSLAFIVVCAVGLAVVGADTDAWHMFIDAAAGTLAFAALPQGSLRRMTSQLFGGRSVSDTAGRATASRLGFVSSSLGEIRTQLVRVSAAMDKKAQNRSLSESVFEDMCRGCELCTVCHRDAKLSAEHFEELERTAMQFNGVSYNDIRRCFRTCRSPEQMADSFNYSYKNYLDSRAARLRIGELRVLISEQLGAMEDILSDLSGRIGRIRSVDRELSEKAGEYMFSLGCRNSRACLYLDEAGFRHAEIFISGELPCGKMQLALALSDIADCMFDIPVISKAEDMTRIVMSESPLYELTSGTFSASSTDNGYSGDTVGMVAVSPCESYAVLSDGMGTGKRAKLDSMFAVSLASRLLTAGVSMRTALKLINTMLRVKGWDESFATLDIARFDLCAGNAELLKAGAAPTFLYRDGVLKAFGGQAFPAGILDRCTPDEFSCKLFDGDIIVMVSDGVSEQKIRKVFSSVGETNIDPAELARALGELAMQTNPGSRRDDISVCVFGIKLRKYEL